MTRFWFVRTAKKWADLLTAELEAGRLRQGWGYLPEQDLRMISAARERGEPLSSDQQLCWRGNRRLLPTERDGVQPEDYIITPNLPEEGSWSILKVSGKYRYEIHPEPEDFGHILEVELINCGTRIHPRCAAVAAGLRKSAKSQSRMWNVDYLAEQVCELVRAVEGGEDVSQPEEEAEKLGAIRARAATAIEKEIQQKYQGNEFEKPVGMLLERIYENVEVRAGPMERGADFICTCEDGLGIQHRLAVQVKMWEGMVSNPDPLDQIRLAHESYEQISAGVVWTLADDFDENFKVRAEDLETELSIPIRLLGKDEVVDLFMKHLPDLL